MLQILKRLNFIATSCCALSNLLPARRGCTTTLSAHAPVCRSVYLCTRHASAISNADNNADVFARRVRAASRSRLHQNATKLPAAAACNDIEQPQHSHSAIGVRFDRTTRITHACGLVRERVSSINYRAYRSAYRVLLGDLGVGVLVLVG